MEKKETSYPLPPHGFNRTCSLRFPQLEIATRAPNPAQSGRIVLSFLAPLFLAGIGALSLPLIFHFIRKTPRGQTPFSSLMFLSPSPPRLTQRSRLDNILLLILRCAALLLLAAAFMRPFFRDAEMLASSDLGGRRVAERVGRARVRVEQPRSPRCHLPRRGPRFGRGRNALRRAGGDLLRVGLQQRELARSG